MKIERLYRKRCMTLRRSSSPSQVDTSNPNQLRNMEQILHNNEMTIAAEIDLQGVSGSMPGNRRDIDEIIARKASANDFEYLILPCADRFTRAGSLHGQKLLWDLGVAGITVYFVQENIFADSEMGRSYLGFLFDAARQMAKQISKNCIEGINYAFLNGKIFHCHLAPYGFDRLMTVDGKPTKILRVLADGSQEMWSAEENPADRKLIQTFAANPSRGTINHYRKQKNEITSLIAGDPKKVAIIEEIMRNVWMKHMGGGAVARILNERGVPSARGGFWCIATVYSIAKNPTYIGMGIRNRWTAGIYHNGSKDGKAVVSEVTLNELASRSKVARKRRSREHWMVRYYPALATYLSAEVREAAFLGIQKHLDKIASGKMNKKHERWVGADSMYLLSGILRSKQGNMGMYGSSRKKGGGRYSCGTMCQRPGAFKFPENCASSVVAAPLNDAVLKIIKSVVMDCDLLTTTIDSILGETPVSVPVDLLETVRDIRALSARHIAISRRLTGVSEADAPYSAELDSIDNQIERIKHAANQREESAKAPVTGSELAKRFKDFVGDLDKMDRVSLKKMLRLVVKRAVVDLETMEVELDLTLPTWTRGMPSERVFSPMEINHEYMISLGRTNSQYPVVLSFKLLYKKRLKLFQWRQESRAA